MAPSVRRDDRVEHGRLPHRRDAALLQTLEEIEWRDAHIDGGVDGSLAAAEEGDPELRVGLQCAEVAGSSHRRCDGGDEMRREFVADLHEPRADQRAAAKDHRPRPGLTKHPQRVVGDHFLTPAHRDDKVKAHGLHGMRKLHWPSGQCSQQHIIAYDGYLVGPLQ